MRLFLTAALCISTACYGFETDEKLISPFTYQVYYRYYLIKRCQEPVQLLKNNAHLWTLIEFEHLTPEELENDEIKNNIKTIKKDHLITSFMSLWHQMQTHRHITDPSFQKDFITLLFMLYKSLEKPPHKHTAHTHTPSNLSIEKMLSMIEKNIETMRPHVKHKSPPEQSFFESNPVTTDDIALNHYLIHRLDKAMQLLSDIHDEAATSPATSSFEQAVCNLGISFSHERINSCANQMIARKNLEPVLQMWQEFIRFRHAGDAHFLKEMLMMLFAVYKDLLFVKLNSESEDVITNEMNTILDLYEHVDDLPLDEILHAIDLTTDKLLLLQSMDKKSKQGWEQRYPVLFHTLLALPIAYLMVKACAL